MIWTLYELALNLYQGFLFTWFITEILPSYRRKHTHIPFIVCGILTAAALSSYLFFEIPLPDSWIFVFIIAYALLFLEGSVVAKLFWLLVLIAASTGITGIHFQVTAFITGADMTVLMQETGYRIFFTLSGNLVMWVVFFVLTRIFRKTSKSQAPSCILLVTVFLCVILIDIFFRLCNDYGLPKFWLFTGSMVALSISIITIVSHAIITGYALREQKYRYRSEMMKTMAEQMEELEDTYMSMRRLRHDMNAYVNDIKAMVESGELAETPVFLAEMEKQLTPTYSTGNMALDSVILLKAKRIRAQGIDLRCSNLHYTGGMNISDASLCSLIANMLDNATEALLARKELGGELYIYFQFSYFPGGLMIICENPLLGVMPRMKRSSFFSSKRSLYHGLGISIMEAIAHDAGGQFDIVVEDDMFKILACIPPKKKGLSQ